MKNVSFLILGFIILSSCNSESTSVNPSPVNTTSNSSVNNDVPCGFHNGHQLYKGPNGGCYYKGSNGNKVYVDKSLCNC